MLAYSDALGGPQSHVVYCQLQTQPCRYIFEAHLALRPIRNETARIRAEQDRAVEEAKIAGGKS